MEFINAIGELIEGTLTSQKKKYLVESLKNKAYMKAFCDFLNFHRVTGLTLIGKAVFNFLGELMNRAVTPLFEDGNFEVLHRIILLSQSIYCLERGQKKYLVKCLKAEEMRNFKFWDAFLDCS